MAFSMKVTPEIEELTNICLDNSKMDVSLYGQYDVKRGLRDINGVGVLAGLTQISNVVSSDIIDGVKTPCDGRLYYRGINVEKLTQGFLSENRMGFEEVAYLLLFGNLPNEEQLNHFKTILKQQQSLPKNFVRDVVMKAPTKDMMNTLSVMRESFLETTMIIPMHGNISSVCQIRRIWKQVMSFLRN